MRKTHSGGPEDGSPSCFPAHPHLDYGHCRSHFYDQAETSRVSPVQNTKTEDSKNDIN